MCANADLSADEGVPKKPGMDAVTSLPVVCTTVIEGGEEEGLEGGVGQQGTDVTNGAEERSDVCADTGLLPSVVKAKRQS